LNGSGAQQQATDKEKEEKETHDQFIKKIYDLTMSRRIYKTMTDSLEILCYDDKVGIYHFGGETKIRAELEKIASELSTNDKPVIISTHIKNEIVDKIKYNTLVERKDFDSNHQVLNLKNGLLDIKTGKLSPHTPDNLSLKQWPVVYPKHITFPKKILQFFREIQDGKGVITLIKMFGYILMIHSAKYEKAFMFIGGGDNGKSVLIKLIEAFVGEENRSNVRLQDLSKDKFMAAKFFGKIVNTYADIPPTDIVDSSLFKILVSGDSLLAQNKYGQIFPFRNYAKLIFSANKIPRSFDDDEFAYFRRWVILKFNAKFTGINKDRDLIHKPRE
jgi:putative DNA primase/helicase